MLSRLAPALVLALLLAVPQFGCSRERAEVDGIGTYKLGHTSMAEAGACSEREDYTYCSNNGAVAIGGQSGGVDLYFRGKAPEATATEILVVVRRCQPEPIEEELQKELGAATYQTGGHSMWVGKKATIIARLPAEKGICEVTFLHPSETERIAKLSPPAARATAAKTKN